MRQKYIIYNNPGYLIHFLRYLFFLPSGVLLKGSYITEIVIYKSIAPKEELLLGYVLRYIIHIKKRKQMGRSKAALPGSSFSRMHRRCALLVEVGLYASSLGPTRRSWALCLSIRPPSCRFACRLIDSPAISSIHLPSRQFTRRLVDLPAVSSIHLPSHRFTRRLIDSPAVSSIRPPSRRFARHLVDSPAVSSIHPLGCQWACYLVDWATVSLIRWPAVLSFDLTHRGCAVCSPHPSGEGRGMSWWMAIVGSELGPWAVEIRRWDQP